LFSTVRDGKPDDDLLRITGKVERALERLRRVAVKAIDARKPGIGEPDESRQQVETLLIAIVDIMTSGQRGVSHFPLPLINTEDALIAQSCWPDLLTQSLDTLFTLARAGLNVTDPQTYDSAYDHLARAAVILEVEADGMSKEPVHDAVADIPNYARCVSGAFHNLAGTLYQGGKYGSAVRFLREACTLGVKALNMRRVDRVGGEGKVEEGWRQLEDQLYRRWELLGVCYSKIGDRKVSSLVL
jgi:separase